MKRFLNVLISLILLSWITMPAVIARAAASSTNLIANPSVVTANSNGNGPANWTANNWGTNTTSMVWQNGGYNSSKSLYISTTARTNGDAKWIPDAVAVTPGQQYTYSDYYEANVATELDAEYFDASGNASYVYLENVPISTTWSQASINFTVPANAVKVSVLHILANVGNLQTDDFSLITTPVITPPANTNGNLVLNPSFETANGSTPVDWQTGGWGTNTTKFIYDTTDGHTGTHSAVIQTTSYTSGDAKWYFNQVAVTPNTQYTYSDYYKSTIPTSLVAQYDNGSGVLSYAVLSASVASATNWQQASVTFTAPATAEYVTIFHLIAGVGTLQIDDVSLMPAPVVPTTVTITSPIANAKLSGNVAVTASVNATVGISSVQFKLDGNNLGSAITYAPFQQSWNTATATNGIHDLTAVVTTTDSKTTTSTAVPVTVSNSGPVSDNIIPNPSLETVDPTNSKQPLDWFGSSWGTNTSAFTYLSTGHTGNHSVKVQTTSYTTGAAYWDFANQPVVGGQMYDFSDYYESNINNEVDATIVMSDGSLQYLYLSSAYPSPNSWTKFDVQFTVPAGAVAINIEHNIFGVGWLTTDDYNLAPFSYQGLNRPLISITDDDSYASFYTNGLPILQKYGLTSTDYIITSYIDNVDGYMSSAQVKGLYAAGEEIGSHSVDHPDLTTLTATQQNAELQNSQIFLQNLIGAPVTDYAAPYGSTNSQVVANADKYYKSYRGVEAGYNAKNNFDANNLLVQNVIDTTTLAQIQSWIAEAQATNTWLILVYHQVDPDSAAGEYNTYPSDFDAQMSAVKASGITVETVSQALKEVEAQL
ncbi:MAG: polysaccharide deacetylase family protein [Candidatus Saccharimonadales bacterium]